MKYGVIYTNGAWVVVKDNIAIIKFYNRRIAIRFMERQIKKHNAIVDKEK